MDRRSFIALGAAGLVLPSFAAAKPIDYTPGMVQERLAAGETVFLDFKADWCSTCAAQERVINALLQENPAYQQSVTFINVDWDQYGRSDLARGLQIPRRSTLVVLKGDQELGRIVAGTRRADIQALMDTALNAAVS